MTLNLTAPPLLIFFELRQTFESGVALKDKYKITKNSGIFNLIFLNILVIPMF